MDTTSVKICTWIGYYKQAQEYYKKSGNINVPCDYVTNDGYALGKLMTTQRKKYKLSRLNAERIVALGSKLQICSSIINTE